ncbi:MAG: hypothetical protein PF489_02810 [Salinivirgaceae bacterium]|jgi:hypothetical protein|nr:hypothetical protein [Salinivirgaceae bacterium]
MEKIIQLLYLQWKSYLSVLLIFSFMPAINGNCQTNTKINEETFLVVGNKVADSSVISILKTEFTKTGKLRTNKPGMSVKQFTYSMFTLGKNIRNTVYDSMMPKQMKELVHDEKVNYRFVNIEGVTFINSNNETIIPLIDTVKVKFLYP